MGRDELIAALEVFLLQVGTDEDPTHPRSLDPAGLTLARDLAELATPDDVDAWYLIGTLHLMRHLVLPEGDDRVDLMAAVAAFVRVYPTAPGLVPEQLRPVVASLAALSATSASGRDDSPATWLNQAVALLEYPHSAEDLTALSRAVALLERAVAATSADDPNHARGLSSLGNALLARFKRGGEIDDLERAVTVGRQVVASFSDHPDRAAILANFAAALRTRFEQIGEIADLGQAVDVGWQAVAATSPDHPTRTAVLINLGAALLTRYGRVGALDDLDQAIDVGQRAAAIITHDDPARVALLSNLGAALLTRFGRVGAQVDLDHAVEVGRQAIDACPEDTGRGRSLSNLSATLRTRFERIRDNADLNEAVEVGRQAVAAIPADHPDRAASLSNLCTSLQTRFDETGEIADLDQAVDVGRQAVAATPSEHPSCARRQSNLGVALRTRFERVGALDDLDQAIDVLERAVAGTPDDHPDCAGYLTNLGTALSARFEALGETADLRSALTALQLGAQVVTAPPLIRARCGRSWASLAGRTGDWVNARTALTGVVELLPLLVDHGLTPGDRRHHLTHLQGLGPVAAYAEIVTSEPRQDRVDAAWAALEAGRAVLLSQALEARTDVTDLRRVDPAVAEQIDQLRHLLSQDHEPGMALVNPPGPVVAAGDVASAQARDRQHAHQRRQWADQWRALLARVRAMPELTSFGLPPTPAQMRAAAGDGTVVAVNVTEFGCFALTLTGHGVAYLPLPGLTAPSAAKQATRFLHAIDQSASGVSSPVTMEVLAWLWDVVAWPVLAHLSYEHTPPPGATWPRIWWIPTGPLAALPLHAAGHHGDPAGPTRPTVLDRVISSYTTTVRALHQAHRRQPHRDGALIVGINRVEGLPTLASAEREAVTIHRHFNAVTPPLLGADATYANVTVAMARAGWVHFACHAFANQEDPAESHLVLADQPLRVRELAAMELPDAYLAYLSACTTATGADRLIDESIHIASAFQLAGFHHTVATLWPVPDRIALRFARDVYPALRSGTAPARAVHEAVRALRARYTNHPNAWAAQVHFGP